MARPLRRDVFAWVCNLPSSVILIVCLFLPQERTCQGHARTPIDNGTAWMLVALAGIALGPAVWRVRGAREPLTVIVVAGAIVAAISSVVGIAVAGLLAWSRPWRSREELVAMCSFVLAVAFVIVFPFVFILATSLVGGDLAWGAGWAIAAGSLAWWSAACTRPAQRESSSSSDARIC